MPGASGNGIEPRHGGAAFMEVRRGDGRDGPGSCVNHRGEIPAAASKMSAPELAAPRREEDAMMSTRTETARKIGSSADHRGHPAGEGKTACGGRPGARRLAVDDCLRQLPASGSGPAEEPDRRGGSIAQVVQCVIEQGVR